MTYQPQPGTYGFRLMAHFHAHRDATLTMSQLCEVLGGNVTPQNLKDAITPLVNAALLERFTRHGLTRPCWYRLAKPGALPARMPTVEDEDHAHVRQAPTHAEVLATARKGNWALPCAFNGAHAAEAITPAPSDVERTMADTAHIRAQWAECALRVSELPSAPVFCSSAAAPLSAYQHSNGRDAGQSAPVEAASDRPQGEEAGHAEERPASPDDLRAARWLDDSLSIELDGVALKLTRAQALRIVALYGVPA